MEWADFEATRSAVRNWGRWGDTDELGTLNLITAEAIRHAATLVKTGRVFSLSMPINGDGPQGASGFRRNPIHLMTVTGGDSPASLSGMAGITSAADAVIKTHAGGRFGFTDDYLMMPLQAASHMDALSHAYFDGYFYNGVPASAVTSLGASRPRSPRWAPAGCVPGAYFSTCSGTAEFLTCRRAPPSRSMSWRRSPRLRMSRSAPATSCWSTRVARCVTGRQVTGCCRSSAAWTGAARHGCTTTTSPPSPRTTPASNAACKTGSSRCTCYACARWGWSSARCGNLRHWRPTARPTASTSSSSSPPRSW